MINAWQHAQNQGLQDGSLLQWSWSTWALKAESQTPWIQRYGVQQTIILDASEHTSQSEQLFSEDFLVWAISFWKIKSP